MVIQPLVSDSDVYSLGVAELRFREACQFYLLFKGHQGEAAGIKNNRFLWLCYVDAFLLAIVSLKDLTDKKIELDKEDIFRLLVVMRNVTAHRSAVSGSSEYAMIARDITFGRGPMFEEPVISSDRLASALEHYRNELENPAPGRPGWKAERWNFEGALRWQQKLESGQKRVLLSDVFFEAIQIVAKVCGFTVVGLG